MNISYQLTEKDVVVAQSEATKRCRDSLGRRWQSALLLWGGALTFGIAFAASLGMYRLRPGAASRDFSFVLIPACLGVVLTLAYGRAIRKASLSAYLAAIGPIPLAQAIALTDDAIELSGPVGCASIPCNRVMACSETATRVLIVVRPWTVVAIPRTAFARSEDSSGFVASVRAHAGL
jgi:hypothetical protein